MTEECVICGAPDPTHTIEISGDPLSRCRKCSPRGTARDKLKSKGLGALLIAVPFYVVLDHWFGLLPDTDALTHSELVRHHGNDPSGAESSIVEWTGLIVSVPYDVGEPVMVVLSHVLAFVFVCAGIWVGYRKLAELD